MSHRLRIGHALAMLAVALVAPGCSGDPDVASPAPVSVAAGTSAPASGAPAPDAALEVTPEDAEAIALEAVGGGQVLETDLDEFEVSIQVWEVTVLTPEGVHRQVSIDLRNGSVIGNETDD